MSDWPFLVNERDEFLEYIHTCSDRKFVFLGCKVRMLIMDCPDGYICRLRGTTAAGFSEEEKTLGLDFCKVYQLIWMAMVKKKACHESFR